MRRRRTRRCSAATALASRGTSALQAWLWLLLFIFQNEFRISDSIQPGYLDFDNLPDTNFSCTGKVIGGYYADLETSCQMFHVCTVGQGDEPMDIKFLCLNGTVFDQETRVCERVDEVDCTKSEKFYSLNLELYGNTAAPVIEPEHESHDESHDQHNDHSEGNKHENKQDNKPELPSSSAQPDPSPEAPHKQHEHHTEHVDPVEETVDDEEEDEDIDDDYEDYIHSTAPSTTLPASTTTQLPPPTTTTMRPTTTQSPPVPSTSAALPTYGVPSDPTLLSPHEFTYQHRPAVAPVAPPPPALSFQRQSYPQHAQPPRLTLTAHRSPSSPQPPPRPADSVYITAAPPSPAHQFSELEQIDHYELYESSKNAPRRPHERPAPFLPSHASRIPQGFRPPATASPPRSQLPSPSQYEQRPVQSYQPSERHEIYDDRYRSPPQPPQPTFDYNRFHFDRKRSHETEPTETIQTKSPPLARSASIKPTAAADASSTVDAVTERPTPKFAQKSPPRVIVTASASVSDSNGKKLNYTVGNVVSAVKPIVPINYDDYKESDLIFDPFFLDVPKLKRRRKINSGHGLGKRSAVITLTHTVAPLVAPPSVRTIKGTTTPAAAWVPPDYVDDNYEPNSYVEAPPPAPSHRLDPINRKEEEKQMDVKTEASEIVASSQIPATSSTAPAKPVQKKPAAKIPSALRPLLAVLPRPSRGEYHVVRAGPTSPGRYSCEGQRPYEVWADARDCRSFYVCTSDASGAEAAPALHVHLQCAPGLQYDKAARVCALPPRHQIACHQPLDNV